MTALRQSAIMELEKIPEDKLTFVIQIMQGVNGLCTDVKSEREEAFSKLELLRRKGTVADDNEEFSDFEDCLQMECAKAYEADYIITRNVSDYATSQVRAIEPEDYLKLKKYSNK